MALKDIAAEVGVSISTVSRVLNTDNTPAASEDLKQRIWEVARKQGYMPNLSARHLKSKTLSDIPEIHYINCIYGCAPQETKDDPFYSILLKNIEHEAFKHNYHVGCSYSSANEGSFYASPLISSAPSDCLIILGRFKPEFLKKLQPTHKKIVYIGLNVLDVPCDQVVCDGYKIAQSGVSYLSSLHHQKIAFVGSNEQRMDGYKSAIATLTGTPAEERFIVDDAVLSMEGGFQGTLRLLNKSPDTTAIVCANDMTAIGALRACHSRNIRVPEDISIIGINDIENVQYTVPMLSSIRVPLDEMGAMAVKTLLDRVNGGHNSPMKIEFPFQIIKRGSCRAL